MQDMVRKRLTRIFKPVPELPRIESLISKWNSLQIELKKEIQELQKIQSKANLKRWFLIGGAIFAGIASVVFCAPAAVLAIGIVGGTSAVAMGATALMTLLGAEVLGGISLIAGSLAILSGVTSIKAGVAAHSASCFCLSMSSSMS